MIKALFSGWLTGLAVVTIVVGGLGAIYVKGRVDGGRVTEARWQAKIAKAEADWQERQRQAQEAAFKEIEALNEEKQDADRLIEKLRAQALADPGAAGGGLSRDGMRRIGSVR